MSCAPRGDHAATPPAPAHLRRAEVGSAATPLCSAAPQTRWSERAMRISRICAVPRGSQHVVSGGIRAGAPWWLAAILAAENVRMALHDVAAGLPEVLTAED